jgi:hypothetical protein
MLPFLLYFTRRGLIARVSRPDTFKWAKVSMALIRAMDYRVGIAEPISEGFAHRQVDDLFAIEGVDHDEAFGIDRIAARPFTHAEPVERGECVWSELNAGADLADRSRLLEKLYVQHSAVAQSSERSI